MDEHKLGLYSHNVGSASERADELLVKRMHHVRGSLRSQVADGRYTVHGGSGWRTIGAVTRELFLFPSPEFSFLPRTSIVIHHSPSKFSAVCNRPSARDNERLGLGRGLGLGLGLGFVMVRARVSIVKRTKIVCTQN